MDSSDSSESLSPMDSSQSLSPMDSSQSLTPVTPVVSSRLRYHNYLPDDLLHPTTTATVGLVSRGHLAVFKTPQGDPQAQTPWTYNPTRVIMSKLFKGGLMINCIIPGDLGEEGCFVLHETVQDTTGETVLICLKYSFHFM